MKSAGLVAELRTALRRNQARLAKTRIGIAGVGVRGVVTHKPSQDHQAIVAAVERLLVKPSGKIRNVYQDIRSVAGAFGAEAGDRELILVAARMKYWCL